MGQAPMRHGAITGPATCHFGQVDVTHGRAKCAKEVRRGGGGGGESPWRIKNPGTELAPCGVTITRSASFTNLAQYLVPNGTGVVPRARAWRHALPSGWSLNRLARLPNQIMAMSGRDVRARRSIGMFPNLIRGYSSRNKHGTHAARPFTRYYCRDKRSRRTGQTPARCSWRWRAQCLDRFPTQCACSSKGGAKA